MRAIALNPSEVASTVASSSTAGSTPSTPSKLLTSSNSSVSSCASGREGVGIMDGAHGSCHGFEVADVDLDAEPDYDDGADQPDPHPGPLAAMRRFESVRVFPTAAIKSLLCTHILDVPPPRNSVAEGAQLLWHHCAHADLIILPSWLLPRLLCALGRS